jgi:hypothetical protein
VNAEKLILTAPIKDSKRVDVLSAKMVFTLEKIFVTKLNLI